MNTIDKQSFDIIKKTIDPKQKGEWFGYDYKENFFLNFYIQEKYKNDFHHVPYTGLLIGYDISLDNPKLFLIGVFKEENKIITEKTLPEIAGYIGKLKNTRKRFTFIPITQAVIDGQCAHSISVLYDRRSHEAEIFNMSNISYEEFRGLRKTLKFFLTTVYGNDLKITYLGKCLNFGYLEFKKKCNEYYDTDSPYKIDGSCSIWTMWYLELRLKHKTMDREDLIKKALTYFEKNDKHICKMLVAYAQFIDRITRDYVRISNGFQYKGVKKISIKKRIISYIIALFMSIGGLRTLMKLKKNK